jgi:hypothetical protein
LEFGLKHWPCVPHYRTYFKKTDKQQEVHK